MANIVKHVDMFFFHFTIADMSTSPSHGLQPKTHIQHSFFIESGETFVEIPTYEIKLNMAAKPCKCVYICTTQLSEKRFT